MSNETHQNPHNSHEPETPQAMVETAMQEIPKITCEEYVALRDTDKDYTFLDVREESEWEAGHLAEAVHIPRGVLEFKVEELVPNKTQTMIICCAKGGRSALAAQTLKRLGYEDVRFLEGGYSGYCKKFGDA